MLKSLKINNIILVESANIDFCDGLNILTGETGAGKSAIMHALKLVVGERADASLIRRGEDKFIVEALFENISPELMELLSEGGIEHDSDSDLIIKRELSSSAKSKIFINNQAAQLTFLKKVGEKIATFISQRASQKLYSYGYQLEVLDQFGGHFELLSQYKISYRQYQEIEAKLELLNSQSELKISNLAKFNAELTEIDEAQIKEGEDEELFREYSKLANADEIAQKTGDILGSLSGDRGSIIELLVVEKQKLQRVIDLDSSLQDVYNSLTGALIEIQECSRSLEIYQSKLSVNEAYLHQVNDRLTMLTRLKKKYGSCVDELLEYRSNLVSKIEQLNRLEDEIMELKDLLSETEKSLGEIAAQLTKARLDAAKNFSAQITQNLKQLNMADAFLEIAVLPVKRGVSGADKVVFYLSPNVGERQVELKEGASGGEVSRVLLAIQAVLASKEFPHTLVFDEIDANIGGTTAASIAEKLAEISQIHQVLCITHFTQVAVKADLHLKVSKQERFGRTYSIIENLDKNGQASELSRMLGGLKI